MHDIPATTKSRKSTVSPNDFRPRLPPIGATFTGIQSFADSVKSLRKIYSFHYGLMRSLAGAIISIPEFESKIALSHDLYLHAEIAAALRTRLWELRVRESTLEEIDPVAKCTAEELLLFRSPGEFISAYSSILAFIKDLHKDYLNKADTLLDRPTRKILTRFSPELSSSCQWMKEASSAYKEVYSDLDQLSDILQEFLAGEIDSSDSRLRKNNTPLFTRSIACTRDERFTIFHETRSYESLEEFEDKQSNQYERDRLELARVQRDEIDAIETFANVLFDLKDAPFEILMSVARFVEDEARHAEAGHVLLAELGYDPYSIPCSVIGINVRAPMPPVLAFAQINIFGELNIVSRLNKLSQQAYAHHDETTAKAFDFIHADELSHVRRGRELLKRFTQNGDIAPLEEAARRLAAKRLSEEGVVGEDYALSLSRQAIFEIMGE